MDKPVIGFESVQRQPSLVETVAGELTEAILSGRLVQGQRLPSERDLGEQFGVSRTVIREAVRTLAARGLVSVTSGRGVAVAAIEPGTVSDTLRLFIRGQQAFDYGRIHEVRSTIEVETARLAAERATPDDLARLSELCEQLAEDLKRGDHAAASEVDFEFHRALAAATQNDLFLIMLDSISDVLRDVRDRAFHVDGVGESGLTGHLEILKAVRNRDAEGARSVMASHLEEAERIWRRTAAAIAEE